MCHNSKIISSVNNGELSICKVCKVYSLTYNNLYFQFDKEQLLQFKKYVNRIDINYWLEYYWNTTRKRKIPITTPNQGLVLFFNEEEIADLKTLLLLKNPSKSKLLASEINYTVILN
jgi:hypothetical protein